MWCLRFIQMGGAVIATLLAWGRLGPYRFKIIKKNQPEFELEYGGTGQKFLRKKWKSHVSVVKLDGRICVKKLYCGHLRERVKCFVEASHLWRLRSTSITPNIFAFDPVRSAIYMEYIDGLTLGKILKNNKADEKNSLDDVRRCVFSAVVNLHQQGFFINDVTVGNLLIERGGKVRVIDLADAISVRALPKSVRQMFYSLDLERLELLFEEDQYP